MPQAVPRDPIYRRRRYSAEIIELCVRWYITYRLSYRDLVAMMAERGVLVTHTTIMRWVLRYVPEYERRWVRFALPVSPSWRMAAGVELAHRIHKRQFSLPAMSQQKASSQKALWECALRSSSGLTGRQGCPVPSMHQISAPVPPAAGRPSARPGGQRMPRKLSLGRSLYLLVMPKGGRYWRYRYQYGGKDKTLALGAFPHVPPTSARVRHQAARRLLANGIDPSIHRKEIRRLSAAAR